MSGCPGDPAELGLSIVSSSVRVGSLGQAIALSPGLPASELSVFQNTDSCESRSRGPFCCVCGPAVSMLPTAIITPLCAHGRCPGRALLTLLPPRFLPPHPPSPASRQRSRRLPVTFSLLHPEFSFIFLDLVLLIITLSVSPRTYLSIYKCSPISSSLQK